MRIGVAGLGFGAAVHVPALQQIPGVEVVGLSGTDLERTQREAEQRGVAAACVGINELIDLDVDALTLALPPDVNEEAAAVALAAGIPVFSEKPLAASSPGAESLAIAAGTTTTGIDFEFAELETFRALKQQLQRGAAGTVQSVQVTWLAPSWTIKNGTWNWKLDHDRGGGVLALLGSHVLYLLEWLFGRVDVRRATCSADATKEIAPSDAVPGSDTFRIELDGRDGLPIEISLSNAPDVELVHEWTIACERGRLVARNTDADWMTGFALSLETERSSRVIGSEPPTSEDGRIRPVRVTLERFITAVAQQTDFVPDFTAGARVQALMTAAQEMASDS